jgi:hypothetical protein
MTNSGGEDEDWGEGSGDEEEREEGDDDLMEVDHSESRDSVKPILRWPERNEEDTSWTRSDGVTKNDQDSLVDHWFRDQIKTGTWDKISLVFPQQGKCSPQQKWVLMAEDTKSLVPIRYQQYVITVKLNPDKHDKTHGTFGRQTTTLWECSHPALYIARLVTLSEKNTTTARRHMSIARLAHLCVTRYFIKTMCPFSHCEDASYREIPCISHR